jgi:uncharacterized OsmC-like protein
LGGDKTTAAVTSTSAAGYLAAVEVRGHRVTVDEPATAGGTDTGPTPTELLLGSLASCYTLALRWAAKRRALALGDIRVTATGTYEGRQFSAIRLQVLARVPPEESQALLRDARRVCYVSNTLAGAVDIEVTLATPD